MNKFVGWDYAHKKNNKCGKCGMPESNKKNGCCKNETKQIKVDDNHEKVSNDYNFTKFLSETVTPVTYIDKTSFFKTDIAKNNPVNKPPPLGYENFLYIFYCTFLI
jgi:hypothetical protein